MERYKNIGGNSSIVAFEIGEGSIVIDFSDGSSYLYTSQSAGALRWLNCSAGQWLEEA